MTDCNLDSFYLVCYSLGHFPYGMVSKSNAITGTRGKIPQNAKPMAWHDKLWTRELPSSPLVAVVISVCNGSDGLMSKSAPSIMSLIPSPLTFSHDRLRKVWREFQPMRGTRGTSGISTFDQYQKLGHDPNHSLQQPRTLFERARPEKSSD